MFRIDRSGPNYKIAPWSSRLLAGLVDYVIPPMLVVFLVKAPWWLFLIVLLGVIGFQGWNQWTQGTTGQSLGKKLAHTSLVREDDAQPVGPLVAIGRYFLHIVDSVLLAGYLYAIWDPKTQTVADKLVRSVVIEETY